MTKRGCGLVVGALLLGLTAATPTEAGPYFGDWGWCWHPACDCPPRIYSVLHYQAPGLFKLRAWVHPSYLDEYPAGPGDVGAQTQIVPSACRSLPPMPGTPYADPRSYFGRQPGPVLVPP